MDERTKPLPNTPGVLRDPQMVDKIAKNAEMLSIGNSTNINTKNTKNMDNYPGNSKNSGKINDNDISGDDDEDDDDNDEFEFFHEFQREKVKGVIHQITSFLKENAINYEYLMIPFRPEQNNEKLLKFLNNIFPMGNGQPVDEKKQLRIIQKTEVWTLFQALKYIWCRLPNAEIIGWKSYLKFKYREMDKNYPKKAFLDIMPQCLDSPNHASIVYDFFDLIVTISSNSKINKMSARKISKMCAIWAFNKQSNKNTNDMGYDFDNQLNSNPNKLINNTFNDGLAQWIPASDAMFHLLLAFLKSFVPRDLDSSNLPKSLKSILFNNDYPPVGSTAYSSQTILTIPLVTINTDQFSRKAWTLLERCNELLDFKNHDLFEAREDYALLKSLFKKKNNVEGISRKMSQESRRLMKLMSTKHSTFQSGWAKRKCLPNKYQQTEYIEISRIDIDDYFIWAWLSTLSAEETSEKRKIFGRSLILEFEFDGFKKWVAFEECDITLKYESRSQLKNKNQSNMNNIKQEKDDTAAHKKLSHEERNMTPNYEKFENKAKVQNNTKAEFSKITSENSTPPGQYHTVIDKSLLHRNNKNNLQAFEHKISKWNPLGHLRKKSSSNISLDDRATNVSSSIESRKEFESSSVYQSQNPHNDNKKSRVISQYSILNPEKYQLPDIPQDDEGFGIDLSKLGGDYDFDYDDEDANYKLYHEKSKSGFRSPEHPKPTPLVSSSPKSNDSIINRTNMTTSKPSTENMYKESSIPREKHRSATETLEELNDLVDTMIIHDEAVNVEAQNTFESLTKFDKYKPQKQFDNASTASSAIPSLKIATPITEKEMQQQPYHASSEITESKPNIENLNNQKDSSPSRDSKVFDSSRESNRTHEMPRNSNNKSNYQAQNKPAALEQRQFADVGSHSELHIPGRQNIPINSSPSSPIHTQENVGPNQRASFIPQRSLSPVHNFQNVPKLVPPGNLQNTAQQVGYESNNSSSPHLRPQASPDRINRSQSPPNHMPPQVSQPLSGWDVSPNPSAPNLRVKQPTAQGYSSESISTRLHSPQQQPRGSFDSDNSQQHTLQTQQSRPSNNLYNRPLQQQQHQHQHQQQQFQQPRRSNDSYPKQQQMYNAGSPQYPPIGSPPVSRPNQQNYPTQPTNYPNQVQGQHPKEHIPAAKYDQVVPNGNDTQQVAYEPTSYHLPQPQPQPQFQPQPQPQQFKAPRGQAYPQAQNVPPTQHRQPQTVPQNYMNPNDNRYNQPSYNNVNHPNNDDVNSTYIDGARGNMQNFQNNHNSTQQYGKNFGYTTNGNNNFQSPNMAMLQQQQQQQQNQQYGYASYVHPMESNNINMPMNMPMNNNSNIAMNNNMMMGGGNMMNGNNVPPPSTIPMAMPHTGMKLHGNLNNKKQERKQLLNNIRSGTFGI